LDFIIDGNITTIWKDIIMECILNVR
jgi:hypothetical protein